MKTLNLDGKWCMTFDGKDYDASVPGLDLIDLIDAGAVPEVNDAKEDSEYFFISEKDKSYKRSFTVNEEQLKAKKIELYFERLDTLTEIYLNGEKIGETSNIHIPYSFKVGELLKAGENTVTVVFKSLRNYIKEKQKELKLPFNSNGTQGHPHIRKSACHFGWDFAPELDVQGISGHCELRFIDHEQIEYLKLTQKIKNNTGYINGRLDFTKEPKEGIAQITLTHPGGKTEKTQIDVVSSPYFSFHVENPELWWCNGLGEQPLYEIKTEYIIGKKVVSTAVKKIGFRDIKLDTSRDSYGTNFQFVINGKPIFSKGANYIPMDALYTRITKDRLYELLKECKNANMNMVRVWGGGFYESDDFYDICDELGILVWQDFCFACCAYPFMQSDFVNNVKKEIKYNVKRLMHHACLAIWCGNNEIESMSMAWIARRDFINSAGEFFYKTLPQEIRKYDNVTPYHACSPSSGKYMKDVNSDRHGDTHIWNVWHGYQFKEYFRKRFTRFASEFGMQSYPNEGIIPHQKCDLGEERLSYYLSTQFTYPQNTKHKIYLTQLIQLEAMREAAEHFRRNSHRCHGSLYWQLNDIWSSASWAALDCEIGRKALMYGSKNFYENVHISAAIYKNHIQIHVSNDLKCHFEGAASIEKVNILSGKAQMLEELKIFVNPLSSKCIASIKKTDINPKEEILVLKVYDGDGKLLSENREIFCKNNELKLKEAKITIKSKTENGKKYLEVSSDTYARYVCIEPTNIKLSDNYFDLSENETKLIEIENEAESYDNFTAFSLKDVLKDRNAKHDSKIALGEALKPMALINRISRYFE